MNMLAAGEIAQYPMLSFALGTIATNHPDTDQGHRLLRPAGHRCRQERRDHLDARGHLHPQDHGGQGRGHHRRGQGLPRLHRIARGLRRAVGRVRTGGSVPHQGLDAAGRHVCPASSTSRPTSTPTRPLRPSSSCRRSRAPTWSRSRSRSDRASRPQRTAPPSTTRTSRSRPSSSTCPAGERQPDASIPVGDLGVGRTATGPRCVSHDAAATGGRSWTVVICRRRSGGHIRTASTCRRPSSSASSSWRRRCCRSGSA